MEDIKKRTQIAIARAVGEVAERLQNYNDHTAVQYALACAYGKPDGFPSIFDDIAQRAAKDGYMSNELMEYRSNIGKELAKHIKAVAPYGYEELKEYAVMFSID